MLTAADSGLGVAVVAVAVALAGDAAGEAAAVVLVVVAGDTALAELSLETRGALAVLHPVCSFSTPVHRGRLQLDLVKEALAVGDIGTADLDAGDVGQKAYEGF